MIHGMMFNVLLFMTCPDIKVVTTDDVVTSWCGGKQNRFQLQDSSGVLSYHLLSYSYHVLSYNLSYKNHTSHRSERDIFFGYEDPSLCCPQVICGRSRPSDVVITAGEEVSAIWMDGWMDEASCCNKCADGLDGWISG